MIKMTVLLLSSVLLAGTASLTAQSTDVERLEQEVAELKREVAELKREMAELRTEMEILRGLRVPIGGLRNAELAKARADVAALKGTIDAFIIRTRARELPTWEVLITPDERGSRYLDGYSEPPKDPWGNEYEIRGGERPRDYEIMSWGPDGQPATEDDISSKTIKSRRGR